MTASTNIVWYHCGRCGSLFESDFGRREGRVCDVCEKQPAIGVWPASDKRLDDEAADVKNFAKKGEAVVVDDSGRRAVRKKRRTNTMMKVVIIWTFLMLVAVWLRYHYTKTDQAKEAQEKVASSMTQGTLADERIALLTKALPDCHRSLGGFLTAGTPESRNQFVVDPIDTAGKMATFYSSNPFPKVDVSKLSRIGQEILRVGETWMIKTRWQEEGGLEFDAVFRRDAGTWRLDWEHFSQFSEYPWALFLAGEGPKEAEFRLLAQQRLSDSENERVGSRLTFTMLTPVFGAPGETGMASPDFMIDRRSDEGLLLTAALDARKNGKPVFAQELEQLEQPGLVQVRVTVSRSERLGKRSFTLEKIHACHWIDSDVAGFALKDLRDDLFGN